MQKQVEEMEDQIGKETKELTIAPDKSIVAVGSQIDAIINECLPVAAQESQNFVQALTLANGIKALRHIFLTDKHIKETVESMQNTHLGFMTDRTDLAIWKSTQGSGSKELKPYRYEDIAEVCIEAMLKGYRITNNEFNMIAGRFYAAKNGKFRMINESEGVTDFQFTTTSPAYDKEQGGVQYAKVQGFASWKKDGNLATLGSSDKAEDKLIFKIRVNKFMGEDAIIGKALSKLFSRVLMRIEGKIMPEGSDVSDEDIVDAELVNGSAKDLTDKIKEAKQEPGEAPCPYCQKDIQGTIDLIREAGSSIFNCPHCSKSGKIEDGKPIGSFPPDHTARNSKEFQKEDTPASWSAWRKEWINLKKVESKQSPSFSTYFHRNLAKFKAAPSELKEEARAKWFKLWPDEPWTLDAPPDKPIDTNTEEQPSLGEPPPETEENQWREKLKTDAYDSLSIELDQMPKDVVMKAKKDIGLNKVVDAMSLDGLEALVKRCKELVVAAKIEKVTNQSRDMINEIEGSYKPEEINAAVIRAGRASLSGCSLTELGAIYDYLQKGEGEDLV